MQVITQNIDYKISQKQARLFAIQVFSDVKRYIADHRGEYESWLKEEGVKKNDV